MADRVRLDDAELRARPGSGPIDGEPGSTAPRRTTGRSRKNQFIVGESSFQARQWTPRQSSGSKAIELAEMLEEAETRQVRDRDHAADGRRDAMLRHREQSRRMASGEARRSSRPRQGYLTIGRKWTYRGKTYSSRRLQGVHEVVPGLWAPARIEDESITVRDDGASRLISRRRIQIVEYRPGQIPPAACPARRGPLRRST